VIRVVVVLLSLAFTFLAAPAALAKGPSEVVIAGPGLERRITPDTALLQPLAEGSGWSAAIFGYAPDPMLDEQPPGELGPGYTLTYLMPGPNDEENRIVQDLYPYATPSPVTYMEPGQELWGTQRTGGGWFVASPLLRELLVEAGLPATPPPRADDGPSFPVLETLAAVTAIAGLAVLLAVLLRRRPAASPAH
jgi:hypothetical protein